MSHYPLAASVGSQPLVFARIVGSKSPLFASPSDLVCRSLQLGLILYFAVSLLILVQSHPLSPEDAKDFAWILAPQEVEVVTETHSRPSIPVLPLGSAPGNSREITAPGQRSPVDLSLYPDHPLRSVPTAPITVTDLIKHRSALDGQMVKVRGEVVHTLLGEAACPSGGTGISPGAYAQPSIYLTDEAKELREAHEALRILVQESDTGYHIGQVVVIRGRVIGHRTAVYMVQE
jgi:hypothetical protein